MNVMYIKIAGVQTTMNREDQLTENARNIRSRRITYRSRIITQPW